MTLDEAYKQLGLQPLDSFILSRVAMNKDSKKSWGTYSGIGATTWMCVKTALDLMEGQSVTIVESPGLATLTIYQTILDVLGRLGLTISPIWQVQQTCEFSNGTVLRIRGSLKEVPPRISKVYIDAEWKDRAIRRAKGPFEMIRSIRIENNSAHAYAEDDEYLLELPPETVIEMAKQVHPFFACAVHSDGEIESLDLPGGSIVRVTERFGVIPPTYQIIPASKANKNDSLSACP